ncbi:MAG: site-2 protease family protein [Alphaproteobacteria bacterium]|nr:site-2 protease family protein [Alphaproteobacteria bacterium]
MFDLSILNYVFIAIPILVAITFHEAAHGWVAWKLGDDTAYRLGRVSFNPIRHIDFIGTILVPALLVLSGVGFIFGWAKPVPVHFGRLGSPRRDMIMVAGAGPGANIILAILSTVALVLSQSFGLNTLSSILIISIEINILLAIFNMLPLPPLDGGRVATGLLPSELATRFSKLEPFGLFIIVGLIFIVPRVTQEMGLGIDPFDWLVVSPREFVTSIIYNFIGIR